MARVLVTPTIAVSPAGGGTASYTALGTGTPSLGQSGSTENTDGRYANYRYTATPAQGFTFVGFDVSVTSDMWGTTTTTRHVGTESAGTWTYDAIAGTDWESTWTSAGYAFWYSYVYPPYYDYVYTVSVTAISVVAVFAPARVPTHLLVNSSARERPAKLVYDPATDLLVADY